MGLARLDDHHLAGILGMVRNRAVDSPSAKHIAQNEGNIGLLHFSSIEEPAKVREAFCRTRDDDQAGGVRVQAMDDPRAQGILPDGRDLRIAGQGGVRERRNVVKFVRMRRHSRGLVDDEVIGILKDDDEREAWILENPPLLREEESVDVDPIPGPENLSFFRQTPIHADAAFLNERVEITSRKRGPTAREKVVQSKRIAFEDKMLWLGRPGCCTL